MQCHHCGEDVSTTAKFCSACGATLIAQLPELNYAATQAQRIPDDQPLLALRPRFIGWTCLIPVIPIQLFMTFWGAGFCGGFSTLGIKFLQRFGLNIPIYWAPIFFGCAFFIGIPTFTYIKKWRGYAKTEYRFYSDRLEYYEGFLQIEQKVIYYRDVLEVLLKKGMMQRRYKLGTVVLTTWAGPVFRNQTSPGIQVADIEGPDEIYEQVKQLVRDAKNTKTINGEHQ